MTKNEALQVLNIPSTATTDEIIQTLESKLFDVKHYLLQMVVVPRLYQSRLRVIKQLNEVAKAFDFTSADIHEVSEEFPSTHRSIGSLGVSKSGSWSDFIVRYEGQLMQAKGQLSMALNPADMVKAIEQLIRFQLAFDGLIYEQFATVPELMEVDIPRQQDQLGSVVIRKNFKKMGIINEPVLNVISEEDWKKLDLTTQESFYKEWLRCSKAKDLWQ